jgi:hypothetical protein
MEESILSLSTYMTFQANKRTFYEEDLHFIAVDLPNFVTRKWNKEKETEMVGHSLVANFRINEWMVKQRLLFSHR